MPNFAILHSNIKAVRACGIQASDWSLAQIRKQDWLKVKVDEPFLALWKPPGCGLV